MDLIYIIIAGIIGSITTYAYLLMGKLMVLELNDWLWVQKLDSKVRWLARFIRLIVLIFWPVVTPIVSVALVYQLIAETNQLINESISKLVKDLIKVIRGEK